MEAKKNPALGIISLVLSIVALVVGVWYNSLIGLLLGIAAIITGAIGRKKSNKGLSTAGMVIGIVVTAIIAIIWIAAIACAASIVASYS